MEKKNEKTKIPSAAINQNVYSIIRWVPRSKFNYYGNIISVHKVADSGSM